MLVVGASASGVQLADELARAGRHVALAAGSHTRIPRRYRGTRHLLVARPDGHLHQDDRLDARPRAGAAGAVAAAGRPARRPQPRPGRRWRPPACGSSGRLAGIDGTAVRFADDLPPPSRPPMPAWTVCSRDIDALHRGARPRPRGAAPPSRTAGSAIPRAPPSSTSAAAGHRHGHLGDRLRACLPVAQRPGAGPPGRDPPAPRRDVRARPLRAGAALPAHAPLQLHRRGPPRRRLRRPPPHPTRPPARAAGQLTRTRHARLPRVRRRHRRCPSRWCRHGAAARPGRPEGGGARPHHLRQRHALHPRPHAGRRDAALPLGPARRRDRRRARRRCDGRRSSSDRTPRHLHQAGLRRGRAVRPPPHRARPGAGRRGCRRRSRHPLRGHRRRSAARRRRPGDGLVGHDAGGHAVDIRARLVVGADGPRLERGRVGRRRGPAARGRPRGRSPTATGRASTSTGTSGTSGPA